jgi:cytochrome c556
MKAQATVLSLLLTAGIAAPALAQPPDGEAVVAYRQAVYKVILWNWMPMSGMIRGEHPFDAAEFARRAERVAFMTRQLDDAYAGGPHEGAMTDALPTIWQNWDDFTAKLGTLQRAAAELASVAKAGDESAIREQFAATRAACKSCHDVYKAD